MNNLTENLKKYGGVILGIVIIGGGYYFFVARGGSELVSLDANPDPIRSLEVARIVTLLQDLRDININESVFSHPTLSQLQDFELAIPEEAQSRSNPFAPVGQ